MSSPVACRVVPGILLQEPSKQLAIDLLTATGSISSCDGRYHAPCFPCTWTSFQNRFFNDAEARDGFDGSSAFGEGAASFFCDEFSLNSSAGAGALGGGPWAVMGWATAAFKGEEWKRRSGAWHLAVGKRRAENAARGIVAMTTFSRGQQETGNGNERRLRRNRNFSSLGPNRHNLRHFNRAAFTTTHFSTFTAADSPQAGFINFSASGQIGSHLTSSLNTQTHK